MATTWPDIKEPSSLTRRPKKAQHKSTFEAGYVQSRPQWTRGRLLFDLGWPALPDADYQSLESFFFDNIGNTFDWTCPQDGATYTVRFAKAELDADYIPGGMWRVSLTLEEE